MNHQQLIELALRKTGTSMRYPFDPHLPVCFVIDKMFALFGHHNGIASVNLKTNPEEAWLVREKYPKSVLPGYHMNKNHWNTVVLDGIVPDDEVLDMLEESYQLVKSKLPKKIREQL